MNTLRVETKDWAKEQWSRCLEGIDPVAVFGPEVLTYTDGHPGHTFLAIENRDTSSDIGMVWIDHWQNQYSMTWGWSLFPEFRGRRRGVGVGTLVKKYIFDTFPDVQVTLALVYNTNKYSVDHVAYQYMKGAFDCAGIPNVGGQDVTLYVYAVSRRDWERYGW